MLKLNVDDDSSEEDEDIEIVKTKILSSGGADSEKSASSSQSHPGISLSDGAVGSMALAGEEMTSQSQGTIASAEYLMAAVSKEMSLVASQEFTDSVQSITANPWDVASWFIYLDEVNQSRGGSVSPEEAYARFLTQYPKSSSIWREYVDIYINRGDFDTAEIIFAKCLNKCRDVDLWLSYLRMMRIRTVDRSPKGNEQQQFTERQQYELAFERAVESVGMSFDSRALWQWYLDFVHSWPDSSTMDPGRKLSVLRKVYQRAVCIPMEGLDELWRAYEKLERAAGELLAERVLPKFNEKFLHARAIYLDRRRYTARIAFDRLAMPPAQAVIELEQLEAWNTWIRFELGNPDNLSPEAHSAMLQLVFDRFLCCFRLHPEVWMTAARLMMMLQQSFSASDAREILREAIETIPESATLRLALAELEETAAHSSGGDTETAKEILRTAFKDMPCGYTFSAYIRYVRRLEGMHAARKIFSNTFQLRKERKIGYEIFIVQAELELDINCEPLVALKTLDLARSYDPVATSGDLKLFRLQVRALVRIGDLKQIRWLFQNELEGDSEDLNARTGLNLSISLTRFDAPENVITSGLSETIGTASSLLPRKSRSLQDQLLLWEDYLHAETLLGQSNICRLDELRDKRDKLKAILEDSASASSITRVRMEKSGDIFSRCKELSERYDSPFVLLPPSDGLLKDRSRGRVFLEEARRKERATLAAAGAKQGGRGRGTALVAGAADSQNEGGGATIPPALAAAPTLIRDFVLRLPQSGYSGAASASDIEAFIRHVRNLVLPPRPTPEDDSGSGGGGYQGGKRQRADESSSVLQGAGAAEYAEPEDDGNAAQRDDIFRRRQRNKLSAF